jgi:transglutaminase-like putative cysteine protease
LRGEWIGRYPIFFDFAAVWCRGECAGESYLLIRAGYSVSFTCVAPTPLLLMLRVHPERVNDLVIPENFRVFPSVPFRIYFDRFGNTCTRLVAPPGPISFTNEFLIQDSGQPEVLPSGARQHPIEELPNDVLMFLVGSRYCDTQRLLSVAWNLFGHVPEGWARVEAILNYTHNRLTFGYSFARDSRTASEAFEEGVGVCRDFAHLGIALCRCMNIPARYCTGYLGDIGVPRDPAPMDFSAWFEVFLEGAWHVVDARHNTPRIGRILMARGLDATDAAISVAFGSAVLTKFCVATEEDGAQPSIHSETSPFSTATGLAI